MKTCPNCGELLGDSVDVCFKCRYTFSLGRVVHNVVNNADVADTIRKERMKALESNALYEYRVETVMDTYSGAANVGEITRLLARYASEGWRLHTVFANEVGKDRMTVGIGGVASGVNSTQDQVIMIFERRIKKES